MTDPVTALQLLIAALATHHLMYHGSRWYRQHKEISRADKAMSRYTTDVQKRRIGRRLAIALTILGLTVCWMCR